jgi:hypothetical protein
MGDDAPAGPRLVSAGADRVDDAGDLATGHHRQLRPSVVRGALPVADRRVDQVHAAGPDGDPNLTGRGLWVAELLVAEVLGRAELVLANRVHWRAPSPPLRRPRVHPVPRTRSALGGS